MEILGILFFLAIFSLGTYFLLYIPRLISHKKTARGMGKALQPRIATLIVYIFVLLGVYCFMVVVIPAFFSFGAKSKESEAKQNLGAIFTCQVAYFGEYDTYAGGPEAFKLVNWAPEGKNHYSYYLGEENIASRKGYPVTLELDNNWPLTMRPEVSDTGFTAIAIGNVDSDDCPDVWLINDTKVLDHIINDVTNRMDHGLCPDCPCDEDTPGSSREFIEENIHPLIFLYSQFAVFILIPVLLILLAGDGKRWKTAKWLKEQESAPPPLDEVNEEENNHGA